MAVTKSKLLTTVAIAPLALGIAGGLSLVVVSTTATPSVASCAAENPCAAKNPCAADACNPCAAKTACGASCNPCAAKAACGACNPCAAKAACGACNPCAAKAACGACNPCAASACGACNPCNPCAASAGVGATECYVPRLWNASACGACNPCAPKTACGACNPCAAKAACGACNPCAAKAACGACNPCAAKAACGACNPCAAKAACGACNPCAAKAACAACNPCAAKAACAACNPCAAKNPCAAANPCAASACGACNPCNPCGASAAADPDDLNLTAEEVSALYDCMKPQMAKLYKGGEHWAVNKWKGFTNVTTHAYPSATHGNRFVVNYVNKIGAAAYAKYEEIGSAPIGTTAVKPSFTVSDKGQASIGPLFIMEKMVNDFNAETANWRYAMIMPGGTTAGVTGGPNSGAMAFCHECHVGAEGADYLFFLPEEVRAK